MTTKTFLFDIGNVLIHVNFERFLKFIGSAPARGSERFLGEVKNRFETGQLSPDEFIASARELLNYTGSDQDFIDAWNGHMLGNIPMWDVVDDLVEKNHRLILFSNTNSIHAEYFLAKYAGFRHFAHHHFSHDIGSLKPHEDFYSSAISKYDLTPEETIYIDDLPENIETGKKFLFQSWQYHHEDHHHFLSWLAKHLRC